ncbi:MAG: DUF3124 domain-containing protein [Bacteroidetes bacterium]|nr:DUF3124 domain-containing protein [Bacteroidota bacterium]
MGILTGQASANSNQIQSMGQSVYVPVYSHIYHGDREKEFNLTATLSIRNTNLKKEIMLQSIDYFDSNGKLVKKYLDAPIVLKKFSTIRYIIKAKDKSGGSGAKFIVRWKSKKLSNAPLIEAIMISTQSGQGISFVSRGQAIRE